MLPTLAQDFRNAWRMLAKSPAFTAVAILTLALGIGANTAIFTVTNALLLRPLPYAQPDRLVLVGGSEFNQLGSWGRLSYPLFSAVHDHNRSFSGAAACIYEIFNLTGHGDPEQIAAVRASWDIFDILGVRPVAGRTFLPEEDRPGARPVILLSYEFAARMFGNPANALGKNLTLDLRDYTVIGVLPSGFTFSLFGPKRDIWAPRPAEMNFLIPSRVAVGGVYFNVVARLRPGVSRDQARAELEVLRQQYRRDKPGNYDSSIDFKMQASPLQDVLVADVRTTILILSAAVGFVLMIGCANVAGLLLSRAVGRRKEFAVRTALGAPRIALIRQLLSESLLMAVAGGVVGIALGQAGTRLLTALSEYNLQPQDLALESRVLLFTLAISLISGLLFGLAPALQLSKSDINIALRDEGRGNTGSRRRNRVRSGLVVAQVALSTVLLVGAGLLIHSFFRLRTASPGFDPKGILTMRLMLPPTEYAESAQMIKFYDDTLRALRMLPGVDAATLTTALPIYATHMTPVLFEGQPAVELGRRPSVNIQQISPDYARVMRVPLIAGRTFTDHDQAQSPRVALVNQTAVRKYWPHENPIGKRIWGGNAPEPVEVVGVLADTKNLGLAMAPGPEVFLPFPQMPAPYLDLSVRTSMDPASLATPVRHAMAGVSPNLSLTDVKTMDEVLESLSAQPRFTMLLLGVFAAIAFLLAAVGIYGVIAYSVAQRTHELGVRIALGAGGGDILRLVVGQGLKLTFGGIGLGILASLALTRLMASLLYETSARDPISLLASATLFAIVALIASYVPARRATRIDPMEALRSE